MSDVTRLLQAIEQGDGEATERLFPLVYDELRRIAAQRLAREKPGQTLQATALVHEAYVRLIGTGPNEPRWSGRNHFLAAAAEAMRRILIDNARRKKALRHGGGITPGSAEQLDIIASPRGLPPDELLALDEALERFAREDPIKADLVKLRYFAGLTLVEAAEALGISRATAVRYWDYARSWLFDALHGESTDPDEPASESSE